MKRTFLFGLLVVLAVALVVGLVSGVGPAGPEPAEGAFPGENGKIAFRSNRDGSNMIYVMNADGSSQTNLTHGFDDRAPAWSPDGSQIAFDSERVFPGVDVFVINADGSGVTNLSNHPLSFNDRAAWSPDGTKIVFVSTRDDPSLFECVLCNDEIYVMNADGTNQTRLTNNPAIDILPAWSPDGAKIAFASNRDDPTPLLCPPQCTSEIYVMNADGSGQTNLTNNPADDREPNWSPDGLQVAFQSDRDGNNEVYVMNADGSGVTRLTDNPADDTAPAWSPDESKIAFSTNRDGNYEIYTMNTEGSGQTNLTNNPADDGFPDWQPLPAQEPTATPTATQTAALVDTATPPTPAVTPPAATVAAAALPGTGSGSGGGSGLPWLIAALVGVGIASAAGYGALRVLR